MTGGEVTPKEVLASTTLRLAFGPFVAKVDVEAWKWLGEWLDEKPNVSIVATEWRVTRRLKQKHVSLRQERCSK